MNRLKPALLRAQLDLLRLMQAHRLLAAWSGMGAVFTLHHVRPAGSPQPFAPNRILDITPNFLDEVLRFVREQGFDIVSLDDVRARLRAGRSERPFVAFTLDDGYHDNLSCAAPVFERHEAPFAVYVTSGMPEGRTLLWWEHLENVVRDNESVTVHCAGERFDSTCRSTSEKYRAFNTIYWRLRAAPVEAQRQAIDTLIADYGLDASDPCTRSAMSWQELAQLAKHPLATIGAHTVTHEALSKLSDEDVVREAQDCRQVLSERLNVEVRHFCYPFGDAASAGAREFEIISRLKFDTATTTRKGLLYPEHGGHLHALPRVSLNGDYQKTRYVEMFLSGAPFVLKNAFRRLDVA